MPAEGGGEGPARTYLLECLRHDPKEEPGAILDLRRAHRAATRTAAAPAERRRTEKPRREDVDEGLRSICASFYELPGDELTRRLDAVRADAYPDLERYRRRLLRAADCRDEIEAAREDGRTDGSFMRDVATMLIAPQRQSVRRERALMERMRTRQHRKGGMRSVQVLKRRYPRVYALHPTWFDQLLRARRIHRDRRRPAAWGVGLLAAYFVIRIIVAVVRQVVGDG